jgi:hypothetical protein
MSPEIRIPEIIAGIGGGGQTAVIVVRKALTLGYPSVIVRDNPFRRPAARDAAVANQVRALRCYGEEVIRIFPVDLRKSTGSLRR